MNQIINANESLYGRIFDAVFFLTPLSFFLFIAPYSMHPIEGDWFSYLFYYSMFAGGVLVWFLILNRIFKICWLEIGGGVVEKHQVLFLFFKTKKAIRVGDFSSIKVSETKSFLTYSFYEVSFRLVSGKEETLKRFDSSSEAERFRNGVIQMFAEG